MIRSGTVLEKVDFFMQNPVIAYQVESEHEYFVERTPQEYAEHIREMLQEYGDFTLEIQEIIAEGHKVYVRWKQISHNDRNRSIVEIASAVYLVEFGKISEYWIQIDKKGIELQID